MTFSTQQDQSMGKELQQNQTSSTMQEISINYKEFEKFYSRELLNNGLS